ILGVMAYLPAYRKREEHSGSWSPGSGCLRGRCTVPGGAESRMGRDDIGPGGSGGAAGLGAEVGRDRSGVSGRPPVDDVTLILGRIEQGESQASAQLLPLVYDELRRLAARKLALEKPGQTLQATALVHEAYLRLVDTDKAQDWNSRGHFFAAAAEAM